MTIRFGLLAVLLAVVPAAFGFQDKVVIKDRTLNVVYIGDSITMGASLGDRRMDSPPEKSTELLQANLPGVVVSMANVGRNGRTTVDFLPSGMKEFLSVEGAARGLQEGTRGTLVFSIMLGTNDSANRGTHGAPVSPAQYGANLTAILSKLLEEFPQACFFLNRPIWYSPNTENGADYNATGLARLESYTPEIAKVVAAFGTSAPGHVFEGDTAAFAAFKDVQLNYTPEPGKHGTFYLHPNAYGAKALGEFWARAMLAKMVVAKPPR